MAGRQSVVQKKKDKRLLVLFLFGCSLLLVDCLSLYQETIREFVQREVLPGSCSQVNKIKADEGEAGRVMSPGLAFFYNKPMPINRATSADLSLLPGIGDHLASRIVQFRKQNGALKNSQELEQIQGIGVKLSRRIAQFVTFVEP